MFTSDVLEAKREQIVIQSLNGRTLKSLLDFIYTGTIKVNNENVQVSSAASTLMALDWPMLLTSGCSVPGTTHCRRHDRAGRGCRDLHGLSGSSAGSLQCCRDLPVCFRSQLPPVKRGCLALRPYEFRAGITSSEILLDYREENGRPLHILPLTTK